MTFQYVRFLSRTVTSAFNIKLDRDIQGDRFIDTVRCGILKEVQGRIS